MWNARGRLYCCSWQTPLVIMEISCSFILRIVRRSPAELSSPIRAFKGLLPHANLPCLVNQDLGVVYVSHIDLCMIVHVPAVSWSVHGNVVELDFPAYIVLSRLYCGYTTREPLAVHLCLYLHAFIYNTHSLLDL